MAAPMCTRLAGTTDLETRLDELIARFWMRLAAREQQADANIPTAKQLTLPRTEPVPPRTPGTRKVSRRQQMSRACGLRRHQLPAALASHRTHPTNTTQRPKHSKTTLKRPHTTTDGNRKRRPRQNLHAETEAYPSTLLSTPQTNRPAYLIMQGEYAVTGTIHSSSELGVHLEVTLLRHPYTQEDSHALAAPWAHDPVYGVNGLVARAFAKASGRRHTAPRRQTPRKCVERTVARGAGGLEGPGRYNDEVTMRGH
ncbi:Hypothetical predicted protein [Pelobates cultripes]|uniref:Uncharacterized protein n=1 Tax=Pelobates cultripes TaxID=61616 RepID=A0AAD1SLV4_PELCU|nr:Hypothetical predicted protein [Pelobates cultripes]